MPKRKKRGVATKKKKADEIEDAAEEEEIASSAKKVAASSTSFSEDDASQNSCFSSIGTSDGSLGFSSHFWCNYCEFSADTKQELITHMRQHMIKCSFCPFSSLSRAEVLRHVKSEHDDEEEVDSSSSTADHDMDKDPCCACIFCDFMTYSTEYLEKHTASKHRGMLPKSVAKMISKSVSAKIRKADAEFYSNLANEEAKSNSPLDKEVEISKSELPSSSNAIAIEEEKETLSDVKPKVSTIPGLLSGHDALHSMSLDRTKPYSGNEEKIEKIDSNINQRSSNYKTSTDWNVKVETMYCLSCPYSNVAIDKLKCHTFSQHPRDAAVTKNNAGDSGHELLDVMFFCVKDTCNHSSNASVVYEDHIMNCCPLHQPLAEDIRERLRSTLKFLSNFHRQHGLKAAPGFIDFVSSFDKVNPPLEASIRSHFSTSYSTGNVLSSQSMNNTNTSAPTQNNKNTMVINTDTDGSTQPNIQLVPESQHLSTAIVASNNVSTHAVPSVFHQQNTQHDLLGEIDRELPFRHPTEENNIAHSVGQSSLPYSNSDTLSCASIQPPNTMGLASNLHQQQKVAFSQPPVNDGNQSNLPPVSSQYPTALPDHRNSGQKWNSGQNTFTASSNESQQPSRGPMIVDNMYNPGQDQQPSVSEYSGNAMNDIQSNSGNLSLNTSSLIHQQSTQLSRTESSTFNTAPFISNPNDQNLKVQPNPPFTSSVNLPATLTPQLSQQSIGSIVNQPMTGSAIGAPPNPPKMLDLLSDTYSILLDNDLDLAASLEDPITNAIPQQSSVSNTQGIVNAGAAGPRSFPQVPMQQTPEPLLQEPYSIQPSSMSYSSTLQQQQPATENIVSQSSVTQNVLSHQSSMPHPPSSLAESTAAPLTLTSTLSHSSVPVMSSNDFKSHAAANFPNVSVSQNTNFEQSCAINIQQSCMNERRYPAPSSQIPFHTPLSGPIDSSAPPQRQGDEMNTFQNQEHSSPFEGQVLPTVPKEIPQSKQMRSSSTEGQTLNPKTNYSEGSSTTFFETPSSTSATGPMHSWQGKQTTEVPNFLVPTSQNDQSQMDINQLDPNSDSNHNVQQSILLPSTDQSDPSISNQSTPAKNQPLNAAKNVAGNSPLSPSIYLNGQAPRHSRSNWTSTDMMPRGAALPQIRARPPAPANFPNPNNVRQNLFPPQHYRGRGRPRGSRMQSYPRHPAPKTQDDDVIVTAVVRGAPSQQPVRAPVRRGAMRGPRQPMPRGPTWGMVRNPVGASGPPNPKKPFDVSKHFVDLACVVNTGNEDDNEEGDEIQIMGVTPGHNASKGPPKAVDAKKFSFCCVHCGQDQGSKQVMKQHMKASHNDSLLGAFRNIETGQLLFFCPQLRCEFMSYDENRLTEHLFSCYNLDKSKQLPFDLQSALKNLRSLKIRKESTNTTLGKSLNNPIDLDGRGLRDNFNNNLTDAFDDMVENTIVRQAIRPNNSSTEQVPTSAPNLPDGRPPGHVQPKRGRPLGNVPRMPRPPFQPRQPQSYPSSLGQRGNPRMPPYQQSHRAPGRRNFRHHPPGGPMRSLRGDLAMRMGRPPMRGHPRNPQPLAPVQNLGNEGEPILIDIEEPEARESTPSLQNTSMPTYSQSGYTSSAEAVTSSHAAEAFSATNQAIMSASPQTVTTPSDVPYSSSLPYPANENIEDVTPIEASSNINPQRPVTDDGAMNTKANPYAETGEMQSQVTETIIPQAASPLPLPAPPNNVQESSSDGQFAPQVISQDTTPGDDFHPMESNEEQVQAILLKKVFAKVPHMPKKLSQRLVLRFKEFAAKRGVVITPNSKVIDEFVERISYKGSNPLSKQHPSQQQQQQQQPSQQQQQQQQQPQEQSQSQGPQQQPHYSAIPKSSYESPQSSSSLLGHSHQSFSPKALGNKDSPMSVSDSDNVAPTADMPHHQQFHKPSFSQHGNISTNPSSRLGSENMSQPQHLKEPSFSQNFDAPNLSQHLSEEKFSDHYETNTSQHQSQRQSGLAQYQHFSQNNSNVSQSQNQSAILPNLNQSNNLQGQNVSNAYSENQGQKSFIQNQRELEGKGNPEAGDQGKDEHEIIETKIILAERDLKFSGAFANIAKSVVDQSKKVVKEEGSWPSATVPGSPAVNAMSSVSYNEFNPVITESFQSVPSTPLHHSRSSVDSLTDSRMSLPEQVTLNEKFLKKEQVPLTFPMSKEGETILVQSSVDHLVSGNENLEVDIAGTPLYANTLFSHDMKNKGMKSADGPCNVDIADEQKGQKMGQDQEPVIDKASGRILLKIKKGNLPRKPHNPLTTNVIHKIDEHDTGEEKIEEQCIRRSERKRKVRQCDTDDDTMTELDNLLSDDDDDYRIESDDESYDESEYERGDSSKKKSKVSADPTAFNMKQKGSYLCWICFKSLASCLGVKRHINRKHAKAFCAIIENEAGDGSGQTQLQLLLFCPRNCSYATLESDAFSQHVTTCQKSEIASDIQNLVEAQACFITQEFAELQKDISSGVMLDDLKQRAGQVKTKRNRHPSSNSSRSSTSTEQLIETGYISEIVPPPPPTESMQFSNLPGP